MLVVAVVGMLAGVPSTLARKGGGQKKPVVPKPDTVESVDAANFSIKVATGQETRKTISYAVTAFTKVYVGDKPAKLEDVQKGMRVSVVSSDGKSASRIDASEYSGGGDDKKKK
jgi:hypothetical protein